MRSHANIHRVRSAAGRAGAQSRWANAEREPTVQVRVFAADAEWLRGWPGTIAEAVRALRQRNGNAAAMSGRAETGQKRP